MKSKFVLIIAILFIVSCNDRPKGENGVVYKSAIQYNDYIIERQSQIIKSILDFVEVSQTDLDSAGKMIDDEIPKINLMVEEIKGMPPYKKDTALRNAAVKSFIFYKDIFGSEYKELIEIRKKGFLATSEDDDRAKEIVEEIEGKEAKIDREFQRAQRDFAKKNNIKLMENDLQKKIEEADKKYN